MKRVIVDPKPIRPRTCWKLIIQWPHIHPPEFSGVIFDEVFQLNHRLTVCRDFFIRFIMSSLAKELVKSFSKSTQYLFWNNEY